MTQKDIDYASRVFTERASKILKEQEIIYSKVILNLFKHRFYDNLKFF